MAFLNDQNTRAILTDFFRDIGDPEACIGEAQVYNTGMVYLCPTSDAGILAEFGNLANSPSYWANDPRQRLPIYDFGPDFFRDAAHFDSVVMKYLVDGEYPSDNIPPVVLLDSALQVGGRYAVIRASAFEEVFTEAAALALNGLAAPQSGSGFFLASGLVVATFGADPLIEIVDNSRFTSTGIDYAEPDTSGEFYSKIRITFETSLRLKRLLSLQITMQELEPGISTTGNMIPVFTALRDMDDGLFVDVSFFRQWEDTLPVIRGSSEPVVFNTTDPATLSRPFIVTAIFA